MKRPPSPSLPRRRGKEQAAPAARAGRNRKHEVQIDIVVQSARWKAAPNAAATMRKAIVTAAKAASTRSAELAIVLVDDSAIRSLNRKWRGQNKPTNVLSFPSGACARAGARDDGTRRLPIPYIGDIVIAFETTAREAAAEGKSLRHHLAHLAVHGFLHLIGHDHDNDPDAEAMERLERRILARLGVPDPYAEHD